jgi:hypothetical protein
MQKDMFKLVQFNPDELRNAIKSCRERSDQLEKEKQRMIQLALTYEQLLRLEGYSVNSAPGTEDINHQVKIQEIATVQTNDPTITEEKETISGAAISFLTANGGPAHGKAILQSLQAKGLLMNSKQPMVHLTNSLMKSKKIIRTAPNTWNLAD